MQLLKLTVFSSLLFAFAINLVSCEKDAEKDKTRIYTKSDIPFTGAQSVPATPSTAIGTLNVTYNKDTRILNYSLSWSGLTDTIKSVLLQGAAPVGYALPITTVKQTLPGWVTDLKANQKTYPYQGGSYSGFVYIDEFALKEQELLNHLYYIAIVTKPYSTSPWDGEIRAQIRFQ